MTRRRYILRPATIGEAWALLGLEARPDGAIDRAKRRARKRAMRRGQRRRMSRYKALMTLLRIRDPELFKIAQGRKGKVYLGGF